MVHHAEKPIKLIQIKGSENPKGLKIYKEQIQGGSALNVIFRGV